MNRPQDSVDDLIAGLQRSEVGSLARAITLAEDGHVIADEILDQIWPQVGDAWRIGFTGPPGAGKSTLVDALVCHWLPLGLKPALLAVDPSSTVSGGALLGDRIRLDHALDSGNVYVRSMANRGSLGGLGVAIGMAADLCDFAGYSEVLLETVGVGQSEIDVAAAADVTVVVLTPSSGDQVQAMKAGLMEIGDIFVVNKSDNEDSVRFINDLRSSLNLFEAKRNVDIVPCSALNGEGVVEVADALERYKSTAQACGDLNNRRKERLEVQVKKLLGHYLREDLWEECGLLEQAKSLLKAGKRPNYIAKHFAREIAKVVSRGQFAS